MLYNNPIIRGFNPDPSICRVGEEYYLVTSSFEYFPALPIYHSRDLVNWEQICNAQTHGDSLNLESARENGGVWAPTLRWHEGLFYLAVVVETSANHFCNYILTAKDPAGPWSAPVRVNIGGIDPSLFFEDGRAYFCTNERIDSDEEGICVGAVDPETGATLEPFRRVWNGTGGGWLEAPHLYHVGEWYYLLCAEGGTSMGHMVVVARSRSIWGPYESCPGNPILTNRNDTSKQACCCGHGDLFEDHLGNWWMVHLGVRPGMLAQSQLGRETFLTPLGWENGWPVIRESRARIGEDGPIAAAQRPWPGFEDDFADAHWPQQWCFVRNPDLSDYIRGDGALCVIPSGEKPSDTAFRGLVCVRQPDLDFEMRSEVCAESLAEGVSAGLIVMVNHRFYLFFGIRREKAGLRLFLERRADDMDVVTFSETVKDKTIRLSVRGSKERYSFAVIDGNGFAQGKCHASALFLSNSVAGRGFTGAMVGLYAESDAASLPAAHFRRFEILNTGRE